MDQQVIDVINEAQNEARVAAQQFANKHLQAGDAFPCGFAWVTVHEKGSTKLGRALIKAGFSKAYGGGLQRWNPSGVHYQNVDVKEEGARAAAKVLTDKLGVKAYANSRLD